MERSNIANDSEAALGARRVGMEADELTVYRQRYLFETQKWGEYLSRE